MVLGFRLRAGKPNLAVKAKVFNRQCRILSVASAIRYRYSVNQLSAKFGCRSDRLNPPSKAYSGITFSSRRIIVHGFE